MAFYLVGLVSFAVGIYLSTITQINLLTGQTSFPDLGVGIPLVVAGIVVVGLARRTAKRNLSR
jgi:Na+-translocating ferredoxin:NAD+ oxidoreductase RnfE subunit